MSQHVVAHQQVSTSPLGHQLSRRGLAEELHQGGDARRFGGRGHVAGRLDALDGNSLAANQRSR